MEGLVLIDELDLHLHPVWQQGLIAGLKHTFPRLQFVATTHSPLLLSGLEDELYNTYFGPISIIARRASCRSAQ